MEYTRTLGRADFIGGIDNEALDFGQLDSFIQVTTNGNLTSLNCGPTVNLNALAIAVTATTTASTTTTGPQLTTNASPLSSNHALVGTPSHLPESPPDSGSEPPYSPADLHTINNLSTLPYHHVIHKTEDILLSSTMATSNLAVNSAITLPNSDVILQQSGSTLLDIGQQHIHQQQRGYRNENEIGIVGRNAQNNLLALNEGPDHMNTVDINCLMPDVMFHHQQHHQTYSHQLVGPAQSTVAINPPDIHNVISSRKRRLSQQQTASQDCISILNSNQSLSPSIKRAPSIASLSTIKPEPGTLSPLCPPNGVEPPSPSSSLIVDNSGGNGINMGSCDVTMVKGSIHSSSLMMDPNNSSSASSNRSSSPLIGSDSIKHQNSDGSCGEPCPMQCIRFAPFQQQNWHTLCDQSLQELPIPHYRVDADKGFNFSNSDDAFVCQKKNHFQVTCHAQLQGAAAIFVRTGTGLEKIKSFHLHFYGVKSEAPTQTIRVEQSQSDRSKKPFHPVPIDLQNRQVSKVTVGRLHFSETTSNNMRKKGRPNPEQRYFQLVVGLHAHTHTGHFPVISHGSERIIVRASNPGQFESDVELCWQRGVTQDSIFHSGCVGINTDRPDESLVVHGNLKISGHIVQPSDSRAKQEISELDTSQQLQNVRKIRVVKYRYEPEFALHSGLTNMSNMGNNGLNPDGTRANNDVIDTGVIAQEVREVLPDAVQEAGSVLLPNGDVIDNFLLVNKDRIYMENIGAVKELCKVTGSLETRIEQLERINSRLVNIQKLDRSKSDCMHSSCKLNDTSEDSLEPCSNKMIQVIIVVLVFIMAICLAAISTLYFVEHNKQNYFAPPADLLQYAGGQTINRGYGQNIYSSSSGRGVDPNRAHRRKGDFSNRLISIVDNPVLLNGTTNTGITSTKKKEDDSALNEYEQHDSADIYESLPSPSDPIYPDKDHKNNSPDSQIASSRRSKGQRPSTVPKIINGETENSPKDTHDSNNVDVNGPVIPEHNDLHHVITDNSYLLPDVDTNLIDVGQTGIRNDSKNDPNVLKNNADADLQSLININDETTIFESEYQRERTIHPPIGIPSHCYILVQSGSSLPSTTLSPNPSDSEILPKPNTTGSFTVSNGGGAAINSQEPILQCPSSCNKDPAINRTPEMVEVPELSIPENVDMTDSNATVKQHKSENNQVNGVPFLEYNRTSTIIGAPTNTLNASPNVLPPNRNINKLSSGDNNDEGPVEVRESSSIVVQSNGPLLPTASALKGMKNSVTSVVVVAPEKNTNSNGVTSSENHSTTAVEPTAAAKASNVQADDSATISVKKNYDANSTRAIKEESAETSPVSAQVVAAGSTINTAAVAAAAADSACLVVQVMLRTDSFNITLGSDLICPHSDGGGHSFNITYNVPLSKFMKENHFELLFITPNPFNWRLCSTKQRTGKDHHVQIDNYNLTDDSFPKGIVTTSFEVDVPNIGYFERQMEFKTSISPIDANGCRVTTSTTSNNPPVQLILYKINFFRDCI